MQHLIFKLRNKVRISEHNHIDISPKSRIRQCDISIKGSNNTLIIKDGVNIKGSIIEINGNHCTLIFEEGSVIGERCYFSCREDNTKLSVGKNTMFSRNIKIMTSDGHDIYQNGHRINPAKDIYIGEHVWIADNVTVLKGTSIGDHSVIGMNALVTKDIGDNKLAVGSPAKAIKDNITWDEKLTF
ncbi:acyltransferase [Photobacterium sp. TY1-4]|uniref:acyltransferase n=1 Tax=Photobacterium sp. TY1-4 TaxID=2899122 RepID=UPI0021BFA319|nr:acyltransferase [Photobacterium sp. TY1-4]UXI01455.1 acyltransferase [Photobacterium sp. TY1-4]